MSWLLSMVRSHEQHRTVNAIKFRWNDKLKKRQNLQTDTQPPIQVGLLSLSLPYPPPPTPFPVPFDYPNTHTRARAHTHTIP